ncbi:hypothetical protein HH212_19140 [Massilia forsythiae]|uniref:Uncharacterized protein n=1 Tax=Massilia forsythiae TaxID=2728020 RepID=A0A7Z2ZTT9_9BURK|nr:hypothetical protein [Massilia forsythiae]QJE01873.1 hypothetical protein HH212_19140 [Massilia forsythiae]
MGQVGKSVDAHGKPVAASKYMPSRNQLLVTWFLLGMLPAQAIPPPPPSPRLLRKAMMTVEVRLIEASHGRVSKISELCKVRGKIPVYADEGNAAGANGWDIPGCRMPRDGEDLNVHVSGAKAISKDFTAYATASVAVVTPDAVPLCSICGPQPLAVSSAEIRVSGSHRSMKFSLNANPVSILNARPTVWLEAHVEIID